MINAARYGWKLGFLVGLMFVMSTVAYAQSVVDTINIAKGVTDVAGTNPLLGAVYIMAIVTIGSLFLVWKMLGIIVTQSATSAAVIADFNSRPCVLAGKTLQSPNAIQGGCKP